MEAELEFMQKQSELSEQYESLNQSLAVKQALLAQQPEILGEDGEEGGALAKEDVDTLCEALAALESKLKGVESERDAFSRQVNELRMHTDAESGQPSKAAQKKLEALSREVDKLKRQKMEQEKLLKARQASDQRVKQLEGEICTIKAQRAAVARRQREEAEEHRAQRVAREREMLQLRRKEEKTALQLSKLEDEHAKQAQVLKRKHEEMQAMQKKQRAQEATHAAAQAGRKVGPGALGANGGVTPRGGPPSSAFGASVKGGSFGGPPSGPPSARSSLTDVGAAQLAARKAAAAAGGGGIGQMTESQRVKLEAKRAEDKAAEVSKAAGAIGANPKEWLKKELSDAIRHQQLGAGRAADRDAETGVDAAARARAARPSGHGGRGGRRRVLVVLRSGRCERQGGRRGGCGGARGGGRGTQGQGRTPHVAGARAAVEAHAVLARLRERAGRDEQQV